MTMGYGEVEQEEEATEVPWNDICSRLKLDARMQLLLRLFEESFSVTSSIEALALIPAFLGDYMVREFDYRKFCIELGSIDEASTDDDTLWTEHLAKNLTPDLAAASTLMLRLAMTIAKAHQLEPSDWKDINDACSNAVRTVPACYRLHRALPGALSLARAWRHLPNGPEDYYDASGNPWSSEERRVDFEEMYHFPWSRIEAICESDGEVVGAFSGRFQVVEVAEMEGVSLVSLEAVRIGTAPDGFPVKPTATGDVVLLEVEAAMGSLLEIGFCIEADFYEVKSSTCFISGLRTVAPAWAP